MNKTDTAPSIPAAWLKPIPANFKIPLWRWILVPATTIMLKRNAGVWMNGTLSLKEDSLAFVQTKMTKSTRNPPESWAIPLADISSVTVQKGLASEKIEVQYSNGTIKLMSVRSSDFVTQLQQSIQTA